jgi:hypothetical protein
MKKKKLLTLIALGVFFIASCENLQNLMNDPPRNLDFLSETLKEGAALKGVKAGSFSAEGGSGSLTYSLIAVSSEQNDNDKFTVEGSLLKIEAPSLEEKTYRLHVRVEDQKGQFLEDNFTLLVGPPDRTDKPGTDEPGTDEPGTDEPGTDEPGTDEPGTDEPGTDEPVDTSVAGIIEPWRGVWYSRYGGSRLDGYRVGRWSEIKEVMGDKLALFPDFDPDTTRLHDKYAIQDDDYFFFYDDSVYGEDDNGEGGNGGWGRITRYIGIVRTVNVFNGDAATGAVIIEYLEGCYPQWAMDVVFWPLPFFGIYYRVINPDSIQMANAVDLDALTAGKAYYTETATLQEAIDKNSAKNSSKFISWGVVIPQYREKE